MRCDKCKEIIEEGEERELHGQTLCEDCYIDALSPAKACDPLAVYSAKSFLKNEIIVIRKLETNLPATLANFHELQQVFLNIINNAQHAVMEQNGPKMLTISSDFDDTIIRVSIEDTGIGVPQKHLQKIFEPLFTTKEKGVGTGLGLSVCYDIILDHNGTIYVASEPGKGTCFVIEIPIVGEVADA